MSDSVRPLRLDSFLLASIEASFDRTRGDGIRESKREGSTEYRRKKSRYGDAAGMKKKDIERDSDVKNGDVRVIGEMDAPRRGLG